MKKTKPSFSLKDQLFNKQKVEYLSKLIEKSVGNEYLHSYTFDRKNFSNDVLDKFPKLELKQRISHISDMLKKYLPLNFEKSVNIMIGSLPELEDNGTLDNNFGDFIFVPFCDYIQKFGLDHPQPLLAKEGSLSRLDFCFYAQGKITAHASAEDSIRYFFNVFEDETFKQMLKWSTSDNYFLRRLASEGSRPKLPWCQKINLDYKNTIIILDNLYQDKSRFVTRSVANHLNDIAKIDGDLVIDVLEKWKNKVGYDCNRTLQDSDLDYIISHGTRTLVKKGHKKTLEFLGYSTNPKVEIKNFEIKTKKVKIGESLEFSFEILPLTRGELEGGLNLIIDYKIYFLNKSGKLLPKVFKIKKIHNKVGYDCNRTLQINKKHKLKIMSTKALYIGEHFMEIIINGKSFGKKNFQLQSL